VLTRIYEKGITQTAIPVAQFEARRDRDPSGLLAHWLEKTKPDPQQGLEGGNALKPV